MTFAKAPVNFDNENLGYSDNDDKNYNDSNSNKNANVAVFLRLKDPDGFLVSNDIISSIFADLE